MAAGGSPGRLAATAALTLLPFAQPVFAQDGIAAFDRMFCFEVTQHANWINANIDVAMGNGAQLMFDDEVYYQDVRVDCDARTVAFRHFLDDTEANFGAERRAEHESEWTRFYCRQSVWREAVALGWLVQVTLTLVDDAQYVITAKCD